MTSERLRTFMLGFVAGMFFLFLGLIGMFVLLPIAIQLGFGGFGE